MSTVTAPSIGQPGDPAAVRRLRFDDVVATYVVDGVLSTRPESFFPGIPSGQWTHLRTPSNDMLMSVGGLLVEVGDATVLIDAGVGDATPEFEFGSSDCGSMLDVLDALGLGPEDIDVLAFTHLHFDHAGWAFDGSARVFPNARYVLAAQEWATYATGEYDADPTSLRNRFLQCESGREEFELIADGDEIVPGVRAIVDAGHTPGHTSYVITSHTGRRLIAFGDAFHTQAQVAHPDWLSAADSTGSGVAAARRRLLAQLSQPGTLGFGVHFGDQPFGRTIVGPAGKSTWEPVPSAILAPPPRSKR